MRKIEELQTKIDELQKELDELKKQENNGMWIPKRGEKYWYINECGDVFYTINAFNQTDEKRFLVGNVFKTREEAEFTVEKLKVLAELKVFSEPKDRKWDRKNPHWSICYDFNEECIGFAYNHSIKSNDIYFESKEMAQKAVETVGESRVKEFYLGVK